MQLIDERPTVHGRFRFAQVDPALDVEAALAVAEWGEWSDNLITTIGDALFAAFLNGEAPALGTIYVAVGTSNTAPTIADTQLGAEVARVAVSAQSRVSTATVLTGLFSTSVANTTLQEAGVFYGATATVNSGSMIDHVNGLTEVKDNTKNLLVQAQFTFA